MSLETRTTPICNYSTGAGWYYPTFETALISLAERLKAETGLPISYCSSGAGGGKYGIAINFIGDNPPINTGSSTTTYKYYLPACVYIGLSSTNAGAPLNIYVCSGGASNDVTLYEFNTGIAKSTSTATLRPNLAYIHHGGKTMIGIATDSMSASNGHLVFGAVIDHTRRRIVGFNNTSGASTVDNIVAVQQSKAFNNDDITGSGRSSVYEDAPIFKSSVASIVPPICSYNVVSMAPFVAPAEAAIIEDVFSPVYLRDDQDSQQFDISNSEYVSRYITSGCKTQGGSQFVVRFESTSNT